MEQKSNNPLFSIIVPTYNRAHTLGRCIDSIMAQTYSDWELIIIDDGSTDDTEALVETYDDTRIRYVWQKNQERSAARNHGIRLAKGDWICFQDSDDEYLPEHLGVLVEGVAENPEYKVIRTGLIIKQEGKRDIRTSTEVSKYDCVPYECFTVAAFHQSIFVQNSFDTRFNSSEDFHFLIKVGQTYDIKVLKQWTGVYNYEVRNNFNSRVTSITAAIDCYDDILRWNRSLVLPYIEFHRCIIEMKRLKSGFHKKTHLRKALVNNFLVFLRFPKSYINAFASIFLR